MDESHACNWLRFLIYLKTSLLKKVILITFAMFKGVSNNILCNGNVIAAVATVSHKEVKIIGPQLPPSSEPVKHYGPRPPPTISTTSFPTKFNGVRLKRNEPCKPANGSARQTVLAPSLVPYTELPESDEEATATRGTEVVLRLLIQGFPV